MSNLPTTLFVSPKQGGILQSSGFLDMKSLMSLSRTAKAHAYDELSLILLIENEVTRNHKVHTVEEAIALWRQVSHNPGLRQWLEHRDSNSSVNASAMVTWDTIMAAVRSRAEVMLRKMMRAVPESERIHLLNQRRALGRTVLHGAGRFDSSECFAAIIDSLPVSQRLQAVCLQDRSGATVLHDVASSGCAASIRYILSLWPESDAYRCSQVMDMRDLNGWTVLHCAARSGNLETIKAILALYPEAQYGRAVLVQDRNRRTAVHHVVFSCKTESIRYILTLVPVSERIQALNLPSGESLVHVDDREARECIAQLLAPW